MNWNSTHEKNSLEIIGVPESAYISTEELTIRAGEVLNVQIKPEDTDISHKLKRKNKKCGYC